MPSEPCAGIRGYFKKAKDFNPVGRKIRGGSCRVGVAHNVVDLPNFPHSGECRNEENKDFMDPGFYGGDVKSTAWEFEPKCSENTER